MVEEAEGSKLNECLRIRHFDCLPTPLYFQSHIEPSNAPAVFRGAVEDWEAFSRWNPRSGGLDYLKKKVGCIIVEAMLSKSGSVFYGDLRSHERVPVPFSTFITSCEASQSENLKFNSGGDVSQLVMKPTQTDEECSSKGAEDASQVDQFYLAQVPVSNSEYNEMASLATLQDDFQTPAILEMKQLVSINFWMNACHSKSSTHYDPHHNLLCVVAGSKQVRLWPPSASSSLYPLPVCGEASNHSAVDILNPDLVLHPRFKHSACYCQTVVLNAGDALFLPEGWFHQVDSANMTIAINFWWESDMMLKMSKVEHMDSYYLRRIVNRNGQDLMLHWSSNRRPTDDGSLCLADTSDATSTLDLNNAREPRGNSLETANSLDMEPLACEALHELISLVHEHVNSGPISALSMSGSSETKWTGEQELNSTFNSCQLEEDPVACLLWSLKPLMLRKILLSLVNIFPRTLEALILHTLSPVAAEILTRKFDEMDHLTSRDQRDQFYKAFYGVFEDHFAAMDSLLVGKELLSFQALKNVLDQFLGCKICQVKQLDKARFAPVTDNMPTKQSSE